MNRPSPLALAGALLATGLSVLGSAPAPARAPKSVAVSYRDLDLATATGRRTLDRRLSRAASAVCPLVSRDLSAASACAYGAYTQAKDDLRLAMQGGGIRVAR